MQNSGNIGCIIVEAMDAEYWKQCLQNSGNNARRIVETMLAE
jgi:hypothetical protein